MINTFSNEIFDTSFSFSKVKTKYLNSYDSEVELWFSNMEEGVLNNLTISVCHHIALIFLWFSLIKIQDANVNWTAISDIELEIQDFDSYFWYFDKFWNRCQWWRHDWKLFGWRNSLIRWIYNFDWTIKCCLFSSSCGAESKSMDLYEDIHSCEFHLWSPDSIDISIDFA
jgi:hypothetical protein